MFGLVLEPTWLYETRPAPSAGRLLFAPAPPYAPTLVRPADEYVGIDVAAALTLFWRDPLLGADDWLCEMDSLVDVEPLADAEVLAEVDPDADVPDWLADVDPAEALADPEPAVESPPESEDLVEVLADSDAADSLVVCEVDWFVDWDVDCEVDSVPDSDSLCPPLPGVRAVLPSVARVLRLDALTS